MKKIILLLSFFVTANSFGQYQLKDAFPKLPPFSQPLEFVTPPDGSDRIFVAQQKGKIYVFQNDSTVSVRKLFLDLSGVVTQDGGEMGLLGLAFHPDFKKNGYFYVNYTKAPRSPLISYISRFQVSPENSDTVLLASEDSLFTVKQPYENHNGGGLRFGPDGYLYIAFGDGGAGGDPLNRAQNKAERLGKLLRIDVNDTLGGKRFGIPPDNPFVGISGNNPEIYAYGLRNLWRFNFDSQTGKLWGSDVGQNAWEEIDIIEKGKNYGWRIMEATHCFNPSSGCDTTGLVMPIWEYEHLAGNASITGGYVYRGSKLPSLVGKYIYADYVSGRIWSLLYDESTKTATNNLLIDKPNLPSGGNALISSFGVDKENNIFIVGFMTGRIYRLTNPSEAVQQENPDEAISIYPNPAKTEFTLDLGNAIQGKYSLKLTDIGGKLIFQKSGLSISQFTINVKAYPAGSYFLHVETPKKTVVKKLIIE